MQSVQKLVRVYSLRSRRVSKSTVGDGQATEETDIELENATMETPLFSLAGRTVLGKIVKVVDGDSLHIVFRVEASSSKLKPVQIYLNCFKSVHLRVILQK